MSSFSEGKGECFCQQSQVYSGIARNCSSGQASCSEPQTSPKKKGEEPFFYRGKEDVERGCFEQKFIGGKWEIGVVAASHWLQVRAATVAGREEIFLPPVGLCNLQGMVRVWGFPFLAP